MKRYHEEVHETLFPVRLSKNEGSTVHNSSNALTHLTVRDLVQHGVVHQALPYVQSVRILDGNLARCVHVGRNTGRRR